MNKLIYTLSLTLFLTLLFLALPAKAEATNWYVDNAASGSNNGTSWTNAWRSFSNISWGSINPGDTVYISGGNSSKTYSGPLTIGTSGSSGNFITITVGANSPYSSGHSGKVIIDNGGFNVNGYSYIHINGSVNGERKFYTQNGTGAYLSNCSYVYIDYIDMEISNGKGVNWRNNSNNCRVRGCYMHDKMVDISFENDGIYMQFSDTGIIEDNIIIHQSTAASGSNGHVDAIQLYEPTGTWYIRNNYIERVADTGNSNCQVFITERGTGPLYFYNNVVVGGSKNRWPVMFKDALSGGINYLFNNLVTSHKPDAYCLDLGALTDAQVGAIKNNIVYVSGSDGTCLYDRYKITPSKVDHNCFVGSPYVCRFTEPSTVYTWNSYQNAGYDPNGINQNAQYDPNNEYRLKSTSPCIDKGENLSQYFTTDRDGNIRPAGSAWDIGPYEYTSNQPSPSAFPKPSSTPRPTITTTPTGVPFPPLSWFQAEEGNIFFPFLINTSSPGWIYQTSSTYDPASGGRAVYTVNIPETGRYLLTARVNAPSIDKNSVFVNFDTEPDSSMVWHILTTSGFEERTVSWGGDPEIENPAHYFNLTSGTHQLIIRGREANIQLDAVKISPNSVPGDANNDGHVTIADYIIWLNHYGMTTGNGPKDGDFDGSGSVGIADYIIWLNNYGT